MNWIPFPFPKCPKCKKTWTKTQHSDCNNSIKEVRVNTSYDRLLCAGCGKSWLLLNSIFKCSCGYKFTPSEVDEAIDSIDIVKKRLLAQIDILNLSEKQIKRKEELSVSKLIENFSYELGKITGKTSYEIVRLIKSIFG